MARLSDWMGGMAGLEGIAGLAPWIRHCIRPYSGQRLCENTANWPKVFRYAAQRQILGRVIDPCGMAVAVSVGGTFTLSFFTQ